MVVGIIFSCCLLMMVGVVKVLVVSENMISLFESMFGIICGKMMCSMMVFSFVFSDLVVCLVVGLSFCSEV